MRQGLSRTDMFVQGVGGVLHGDAGSVTLYLEVTNPGNVGMVLAGSESGLSLEGFQILGVVSDRLVDNLDGDDTVQHSVAGEVDCTLAASGYPLKNTVSADSLEHCCCRGL